MNVGEWATIINNNTGIIESVQGIARIKPEDSQAGINTILRILNYEDKEYNLTNVYKYANYDEKKILLDILLLAFRAAKSDGKNDELVNFMIDKFFKKSYENIEYIPYYDELILVEIENEMKNKEYVLDDIVQVGN